MQAKVGYRAGWHLNPDETYIALARLGRRGRVLRVLVTVLFSLEILFQQRPRVFSARTQHIPMRLTRLSDWVVEPSASFLTP